MTVIYKDMLVEAKPVGKVKVFHQIVPLTPEKSEYVAVEIEGRNYAVIDGDACPFVEEHFHGNRIVFTVDFFPD